MPDAVVIQWARLGDVVQTRVLLHRLRQERGKRVILCADAQFAPIAAQFSEIDDFWGMELVQWSAQARHAVTQPDLLEKIAARLSNIGVSDVGEVYVLNSSVAAVTFAEMLHPCVIRGYSRVGDGLQKPNALERLESARREKRIMPLHIADIWAELSPAIKAVNWLPCLRRQPKTHSQSTARRVGFICDAGAPDREIPEAWLIELASTCATRGWECVLLGRHKPNETRWQRAEFRVKDCRGHTDLTSLMCELTALDAVVGPDTGGLHLAAALGVPVVGLYFGGAAAANTGPHAANAVVLQDPVWTPNTSHEVLRWITALVNQQSLATAQRSEVLKPDMDDYGIIYVPVQDERARERIVQERKQLFDTAERHKIPAVALTTAS